MTEILILRLVHVLSGIFWVGAGLFSTFILMPVLAGLGPGAGPVMAGMGRRGLFWMMPTVALLTILSGLRLMWITSAGFSAAYFATGYGATYAAAGGAAILAFVLGMAFGRPNGMRVGRLSGQLAQATDEAERAALSRQLEAARRTGTWLGAVITTLLLASAAGMAVARYVG